jgi:thiamine-monophosphate kinase
MTSPLSEFELIARYFDRPRQTGAAVALGIGDDCALLAPTPGMQLAVSCDMLVEGRHFFADVDVASLGHKALAVNLSDLAAMGARPLAFTLALALPAAQESWLAAFSAGLFALADQYKLPLIGGDTTRGPLNICITVFGEVPLEQALRRSAARPGDDIWVSGTLGDARLALAASLGELALDQEADSQARPRLLLPQPRVALGLALRGIAHAAIDVSDGLAGDLGHILARSRVGALLDVDALPAGPVLQRQPLARRRQFTLAGGDDYELCFTAPAAARAAVLAAGAAAATPLARVGRIEPEPGLRLHDSQGQPLALPSQSFDHFRS